VQRSISWRLTYLYSYVDGSSGFVAPSNISSDFSIVYTRKKKNPTLLLLAAPFFSLLPARTTPGLDGGQVGIVHQSYYAYRPYLTPRLPPRYGWSPIPLRRCPGFCGMKAITHTYILSPISDGWVTKAALVLPACWKNCLLQTLFHLLSPTGFATFACHLPVPTYTPATPAP